MLKTIVGFVSIPVLVVLTIISWLILLLSMLFLYLNTGLLFFNQLLQIAFGWVQHLGDGAALNILSTLLAWPVISRSTWASLLETAKLKMENERFARLESLRKWERNLFRLSSK